MANRPSRQNETPFPLLVDDGSSKLLRQTGGVVWDNLPRLLGMSLLMAAAVMPFLLVGSFAGWFPIWGPMVLAAAPIWAAIAGSADRMLDGRGTSIRSFLELIQIHAVVAWRLAVAPAAVGMLLIGLLDALAGSPESAPLLITTIAIAGAAIAVVLLIGPAFVAMTRYPLGAAASWHLAARAVATQPLQQLGLLVCYGIVCWLATLIGPLMVLAVAPLGVLTAAITRCSLVLLLRKLDQDAGASPH